MENSLSGIDFQPMRSIALFNQKGAVGKTTTAVNLGAALADEKKRVILIDMDPQGNLSFHLGLEPSNIHHSSYQVLTQGVSIKEALHPLTEYLAVVPAVSDLAGAEVELVDMSRREHRLADAWKQEPVNADFIIIDCPPSLGLLTLNSLCLATEVIIPLQAHFLALQGMARLLETCSLVKERLNSRLKISAILFCQYESAPRLTGEVTEEVENFIESARGSGKAWADARVLQTRIRRNIKLAEAPSYSQSIFAYAPNSAGSADYGVLAQEILEMK